MFLHLGLPGPAHCFPVPSRDAQALMGVAGWARTASTGRQGLKAQGVIRIVFIDTQCYLVNTSSRGAWLR